MNIWGLRSLLIMTALVFLLGEVASFASPLAGIPGRDQSETFLDHCIMETAFPMNLDGYLPCPPAFSCEPVWNAGSVKTAELPVLAGMVGVPGHELTALRAPGTRKENTIPLLIMGVVFISLSNIIRLSAGGQRQQASSHSRSGKAITAEN